MKIKVNKLLILLFTFIMIVAGCFTSFGYDYFFYGDFPTKPPKAIESTTYCVGDFLYTSSKSEVKILINGVERVHKYSTNDSDSLCVGPLQTRDSGTIQRCTWSKKYDRWNTTTYNITVRPHNIGSDGKCTRCGRSTTGPVTTNPSVSHNSRYYFHQGDIVAPADYWLSKPAIDQCYLYSGVGSLYVDNHDGENKFQLTPLVFSNVTRNAECYHRWTRFYSNGDWESNQDTAYYTVYAHEFVNGICVICGNGCAHVSNTWLSDANSHWKVCSTCGATFAKAAHTLNASGVCTVCGRQCHTHNYNVLVSVDTEPTCSSTGIGTYKCNCGSGGTIQKEIAKNPANHTWGSNWVKTEPTCTTNGEYYHTCTGCGDEASAGTIPALGHDWEWKWYSQNGVENAYMLQTCKRCGETQGAKDYTTHTVTYLTLDYDNHIEIDRQVQTVNRGSIAGYEDIGTEDLVYDGVPYFFYKGDSGVAVDGDKTINLYYRKTEYVVTYDANGGSGYMGNQTIKYDDTVTLLPNGYSKVGHNFIGWSREKTGSPLYKDQENVKNVIERTEGGNTVTLYAIWEAQKYTVHFEDTRDHVVEDIIVTYGQPYGKLPDLVDDQYRLRDWALQYYPDPNNPSDVVRVPVDSTTIVTETSDHSLFAAWREKAWDITYFSPSKTQVVSVLHENTTMPPFDPEETGMTFLRWSTTPNGTEAFDFDTKITEDMKLYAVFEATTYTITLDGQGHVERTYPCTIGNLPNGVQTGQQFVGWYYDVDCTQEVKSTDQMPPRDITVYPKFTVGLYKLTLQGRNESWTLRYGDLIPELPQLEEVGKTFKGWVYQSVIYKDGDVYEWDRDIQLEPLWQTEQVTVYYPDGTAKLLDAGSAVGGLPAAPDVAGKEFLGFVDQDGNWVTESTIANKDLVISYKYSAASVELTLKDDDWNTLIKAEAGVTITNLPSRAKAGYEFKGWSQYPNGTATRGPFYYDTTLYAVYESGYQDIYLTDLNQTIKRKTGAQLGSLPTPTKEGYRFKGWLDSGILVDSTTVVPVGGMSLVAGWELVNTDVTNTVEIRYWSDGVRINTEDLMLGEILWDPGAPPMSQVDGRNFKYWAVGSIDGAKYNFGHTVGTDLDLYAVWN